jgi:CRISPR/Cas system-associated exonuclease Cas4 (RecB family)
MARGNNAPSTEGATSKEVKEKEVVAEVVETTTEETVEVIETTTEETAEVVETATEETAEVVKNAKAEKTPVNGEFEVDGRKYKLSDRCPGKLQFGGKVYTREELLTNEEILQSLVIGGSPFVKKA